MAAVARELHDKDARRAGRRDAALAALAAEATDPVPS
jgi:hypothetical protein